MNDTTAAEVIVLLVDSGVRYDNGALIAEDAYAKSLRRSSSKVLKAKHYPLTESLRSEQLYTPVLFWSAFSLIGYQDGEFDGCTLKFSVRAFLSSLFNISLL